MSNLAMSISQATSNTVAFVRLHTARLTMALVVTLIAVLSFIPQQAAAAQTPVPITIDTNSLLTQVNTWTASLDDVVFLGVAISIAIALLTFIGAQILKAFKGSGGGN